MNFANNKYTFNSLSKKMYVKQGKYTKIIYLSVEREENIILAEVDVEFIYQEREENIKMTVRLGNQEKVLTFSMMDHPFDFKMDINGESTSIDFNSYQNGLRKQLKLMSGMVEKSQYGKAYELED
jgi:hypothetical protein